MKKISTMRKNWMKDEAYRKEYDALESELAALVPKAVKHHE